MDKMTNQDLLTRRRELWDSVFELAFDSSSDAGKGVANLVKVAEMLSNVQIEIERRRAYNR